MPALATPKPKKKLTNREARTKIGTAVHERLGKPRDHARTEVHLYKSRRARVNVWRCQRIKKKGLLTSDFVDRTTITDSFYLTLDEKGEILNSNPPIQKRY